MSAATEKTYKTQRYCNTVRVYKQFCQITGIKPDWQDEGKHEEPTYHSHVSSQYSS